MNIYGVTNFYSSIDPLCPQAIQKPAQILYEQGFIIKMISPVPYSNRFIIKKWNEISKLPIKRKVSGIEIFHPRYLEFPRNFLKITAGLRYYYAINKLICDPHISFKPDIIHAHMCYPDGYSAMKLAEKYSIPYIITIRGTDLLTIKRFPNVKAMMLSILNGAGRVIFPSERIAVQFSEFYSNRNAIIIPNGIETTDFEHLEILDFPELKGKKIIVSISSLYKDKGIDINIKAISELIQYQKDFHYIIVGDGEEKKNLMNLVKELNLNNFVTFVGKVNHKKALEYLNMCDVFSLPGWNETFGLVYLEAMYLKKPIVATFQDGIDGTAEDGIHGLFAHKQNVQEVTLAFNKLLSSKALRTEMGLKGHQEVIKNYTWQKHAEKISKVYQEVKNEFERI